MIPPLDVNSGLLPSGCYQCTIDEFKQKFVDNFPHSESRESRFIGFVNYSRYICHNIKSTRKQLINGSFTTNKLNPNDVDFLIIVNSINMTDDEDSFIKEEQVAEDLRKKIYQLLAL